MKIDIHIQDTGASRTVPIDFSENGSLDDLIAKIERDAGVDGLSVVGLATEVHSLPEYSAPLQGLHFKHTSVHVRRVCVAVHFESEVEQHYFPIHAPWSRVHRWACRKFNVSADACGNLELHDGAPGGPPINERKEIGASDTCKDAWLVKPGPESNG